MPTDFYWTLDGDLSIDRKGDIRDTAFDVLRSTFQEVRTRCRSSFRDWQTQPSLGANLDGLIGRPNNRFTAEEGRNRIIAALVFGGFLKKDAIKVRYMPVSRHQLAYFIEVTAFLPETSRTRMLKVQLLYDTQEGDLRVM